MLLLFYLVTKLRWTGTLSENSLAYTVVWVPGSNPGPTGSGIGSRFFRSQQQRRENVNSRCTVSEWVMGILANCEWLVGIKSHKLSDAIIYLNQLLS